MDAALALAAANIGARVTLPAGFTVEARPTGRTSLHLDADTSYPLASTPTPTADDFTEHDGWNVSRTVARATSDLMTAVVSTLAERAGYSARGISDVLDTLPTDAVHEVAFDARFNLYSRPLEACEAATRGPDCHPLALRILQDAGTDIFAVVNLSDYPKREAARTLADLFTHAAFRQDFPDNFTPALIGAGV